MSRQDIERCMASCEKNAQELRRLAQRSDDNLLKRVLTDGVRHIELCMQECRSGIEQMRTEEEYH